MPRVFIGVGSNIEPEKNTVQAIKMLSNFAAIKTASTFYLNEAEDRLEQPQFINGVVEIDTDMHPATLKSLLHDIEEKLQRVRTPDKYAPRTIDLDILLYGDLKGITGDLTIPDPSISVRPFLAIPLAELAPDIILPGMGMSLKEIAGRFSSHDMIPEDEVTKQIREAINNEP